ncbi:hypothetical protein B0T16DRAFT_410615 [Cercophora newfieldiana]|uniref:Uncharacterized protein n=1 Tax=Cercophora newfieldiana TaxID=92897 RepID=A0AA39YDX4_9PEZI|nr:hypothetical protein B0T16DRAFT_410615 [Cercophora newfieldiana]
MKLLPTVAAAVQLFATQVMANGFAFYSGHWDIQGRHEIQIYSFVRNSDIMNYNNTCDDLSASPLYQPIDSAKDVDNRRGIYCVGDGCSWTSPDPLNMESMEMNITQGRYTWTLSSDGMMQDHKTGWIVGLCLPWNSTFSMLDCPSPNDRNARLKMTPVLDCDIVNW